MPKYKPLYSLYKGLKESKYDVPDSYVSFQKRLTQAGDAGAKSRRGLYQSLKESNYDVPDTYEGFYKNLFVPVNSTTSRALKIGENPNTPAVNRYHQKLFDSVDPNKNGLNALSHRAVSQAKRAMNNVRKPVTAKVVDKKGKPTREEFAITPAKTVEDLDREYAQETTKNWENELHDQMADADKDAAKISDMFKSFIGSTDEVGSVWGNMTRGGGIAGTPHSVTTNNGILENTEARQLLAAGDYNRKRKELLQLEQDSRNGAFFDNHSFFRGMYDAAKDTGILTGGASDLINAGSLLATKQDLDNGIHTEAGDMLMQQSVKNSDAQSQYGDNKGWMYTGGVITTNMAPFMVQIGSAGFSKGLSNAIGKVVQGTASKVALGTMEKATGMAGAHIANYIGKVTGLTTKAFGKAIQYGIVGAAQANTVGLGNVANDVINRYTGQVYQDEHGNYKFGTFDSDGKLVHEGGEDFLTAFVKGEAAQTIEFATELAGGGIDAAGTALKNFVTNGGKKIINKYNMENVSKVIDFLLNNKVAKNARYLKAGADRTLGKVELNSIVGESLEEELGIIANTVFTGDNKISDLWDEKQQSQIWGGMLLSIGLMKGAVAPFHAYNAKQYYSYKHKLNKADVNLSQLLGNEKWEELRNQIDATTNEDMPEMVNRINRDVALGKNRQPVREYIQNLLIMRGYDIGNMLAAKKAVEDKGEGVSVKNMEKNQAYQQGRDAYGYDTHEIQLDQEDKQKSLAQLLGISEQQLASMSDEELESFSGRDDNIDRAIYDYQLSSARYEGVVDNARDQIDLEVQRAAQAVDMYTDKSRNTIRNATIKASGGLEDYGVYIISGNIATHDDGTIDVSNSDDMILYYDPTTNTVEHADAMMFAELGSEENADEVRSQAMADAKEKAIKETTGIIDGVVEVGTQFKTVDADGTEHTYEVLADNGDGTAMITIDGNIPTELVKGENVNIPVSFEELQKMKDESDQQRLQAAKAQREQMENERAEQQMQAQTTQAENPAQENNIQSAPIEDNIDYSDIIREDGKVQMVDVSDKDGNNLFPDAKDVFYIQGNKMRTKFVYIDANGELKTQSFPTGLVKIKTRGEVSVDDYKKYRNILLSAESSAIPDSSMIEDNSGTIEADRGGIEVEHNTQPLSEADADNVIAQMESSAETAPDLELTPDNWTAEFGEDGILSTPIGDVKMGENQVAKLFEKGRSKEFGMIKPTLTNPDVIIEVPSHSADGNEERSSSYLFIKTFLGKNGKKVYYFKSVTIKKDGLEISISSHYDRVKRVKEALMKGKLLYRKNDGAQTEQNQPSTSVTTSQEDAAGSSESKDTNISANGNENNESLTFEDGTPIPVDESGETDLSQTDASHAAEWYDNNLGEDADDWLDGEIKKAKKVLEQAKNKKLAGTKPSELVSSKKEKEAAIADAQAHYDSAISIRDSLKERRIAKEENTSEGRRNLIEKARRKFARLKSSVKADAEAVAQIYKETVGSLLHRLYDGTGIDVTDTIPLTAEEYVASNLGAHSLNYEGTETSKSVKQETGLSREDFAKTQLLAADGKGITIDALVHSLWENRPSNLDSLDTQDIRNALIGVLTSGFKASEARSYIENIRIAQAEKLIEEERTAAENAAYYEQQKAKEEEEKKKAELKGEETNPLAERVTETDEEFESDGKYGTIYNKVYLIDGDKRVTKVDEPDAKGNYTGSYYMYDGKRFGDLFEVADYIDGKAEEKNFPDKLKDGSETIEVPEDATDENPLGLQLSEDKVPFEIEGGKSGETYNINDDEDRQRLINDNKVDDKDILDIDMPKHVHKAIKELCKKMGLKVQFLYMGARSNGWMENGTMYLALDTEKATQFVFGHEMTHAIKQKNPEAYKELVKVAMAVTTRKKFEEDLEKVYQNYHGISGYNNVDDYVEEVIADNLGKFINDFDLAQKFSLRLNHPVLATILHAIQEIKHLLYGDFYKPVDALERIVEKAYVDTAKGEVTNSETGEDVSFSLRQKPEPKKKGIGYKVFVLKDGKLYPPMVANPNGAATPVGVWLDADAAPIAGESKTGRPQVKQGGKGTQGGSGKLAYRPGWHLGVVPYAIQFNRKDAEGNKTLFPKNFVFAEVEYAADVDYQEEARQEGINPSGKYQHSLAGLKHLPTDGYYMYRTNPNPETDPWVITGAMKVNRILTRAEQADLVSKAGREPQQIQEGDIVTDDVVNSINQEIADAPKFSLKVYHGSGADFTEHTKFSLRLKSAIEETETNPSDAQKESGNYKKGHIKFGGYDYTIENPKGSTRSGKDANGKEWKVTMHDTYGYIRGKFGKDGDHLDMFINDKADLDNWNGDVFVVDQVNPDGSFDEHKVMYGYDSMDDAEKAYLANYSKGWQGLGNITGASKDEFDKWLDTSNRKLKPFADYAKVKFSQAQSVSEPRYSLKDIKPVGVGAFGNIYNQFRGNAKAAIEFLKKVRGGEAVGALHHKDIGDIDLVWGKEGTGHSDGYGLSKLVKYHPEVLDNLQAILNDMRVVSSSKNRVNLESETHKAGVRLTWDGERKSWLLTAFKKETSASDKRTDTAATSLEGDTALSQTEGSAAKIDNSSETAKENGEKFSLKDEKIKSVAEKFGVNEDDVAMYANAVEKGSTAEAARARANIKRYLLQANEDKISSFKELMKYTVPVNEALKENFGDLDAMIEERRKQVEAQRNAMEAARKRAQEEEEKRQKHLDELSLIPTDELDKRYMDAIANNDESTAREMLDESARRKGYGDVDSDYQGQGAWAAPSNPQYESDEARRADIENSPDVNLEDIALGYNLQPDDYFDNPRAYMNNTAYGLESAHVIKNALDAIKNGEKDVKVKVYRAVPTSVKEGKLRNGDWVTPSKKYAEMHGDNRLEGKYRIIEDEVPANQLWWDGNDANEFGFDDGKEYRYKNAKNNRKLNDLITYDNKGNVIPPSKRFNSRKSDIRFSLKEEKKKIVADSKANGTYMTAPNGEKTKLDAEQWATVRTANFKNWFGDWENDPENASKVVDENGEPMVVWHGRSAEFNTFEKKEGVRFIMGLEDKVKAEGFFFSPDKGLAEEFASNSSRHRGGKANVVPCFLNIRRPMDLTGEDYDRIYEDVTGWEYMVGMDTQDNLWGIMDEEGMADKIKEKGYDGAIFVEEVDDSYEPTKISYCALDANQIKSAENNNGDFSADNNDIRFSLKSMMAKPEGWKQANKKAIHIAEAIERDPKFSLKNLDGTLIKAGTYFSGGGLVEEGLKGIIDPVVAVEYDEKISGVYRNNFGQHIVTADVRDVDPRELVKQIDGEVEYFHASPVCKNYSQAKSNHAEVELDKETAASTSEFINAVKPKVVTIENVKGYKDSEAMKIITDALDANGYTWDADVYNAADYGGYTNRERLIVRAVRDGKLPEKPKKMARKSGWYEAVADIIPTLTEKKNGVAPWMDIRLKADGIDWRNIDKPLYVMGSAYADGKIPHAFADELLPTLRTKSGDVIVMPDGKVYRAMGRVLARVSGVSDDYKMPFSENLSHTIIGNGIPTQLTEHVIAPLLTGSDPKFSIRTYHGTGAKFDKFDFTHMGEGEGSQAFGWGGYVTNSKDIAEDYTRRAKIRKDNGGFEFVTDMSANNKDMVRQYIYKYKDVNKGLDAMRKDLPSALEMFPDDDDLKELSNILAKKNEEIAVPDNIAYLYDVDIPDDNGDYLDWDAPLTDKQKNTIIKELRRLKIDFDDFKKRGFSFDGSFGGNAYDFLMYALRRTKKWKDVDASRAVSKFLSSIGFTGIKYKAGTIFGGAKEGDYNYVIFDENNANIVGNTRFSLRYDKFEHDLNQWKKDNNLPKDAQRPSIPQRNAGESAVDFLRRVDDYRKQMALWKTAPTYEQHLLSDDTALGEFNRELQRGSVLKRIAFQDSMLAIRKAQEAIMKEVGVDRLNMAEDAYTAENRSHGKGKNEFEEYNNEFLQPLRKAYHQMKKVLGDSYDNVRIYMMAKHGLERDAQMAFKKSLEADYEDVAQRSAAYKAYKGDMNRMGNDSGFELGYIDFNTWRQRDNALRVKYSPSYMNYRYDKMGIAYDYSGLSALFGGSDFEEAASKLVRDIESSHVVEVQDLWNATNAATKKILRDGYKAGMMSKDTYQYVRDMYSHYIPLRGWDGTTADQVWDYIGGGKGAFNQTLKTANGRTSIADDPIAYIENMAESGILLNNKNWVKQHLMLLAQNHPTSLLTLSKAWYVKSTDANGNEEWIPATPQITSQMDSNQVKAAIDAFEKKMEQMAQTGDATQKRDGLNIAYPQTHSEEREHEVRVMKDGEEYVIYVNGDPQLAQAMNNTRAHRVREIQSGKLDRAAAWLGRKMAAAYTSLSPLFIPSNYFRDLTMTLASTAIREDAKYNYLLRKNLATSWNLGFMLRDYQNGKLRDKVNNGNATPKEQMFYDFMMNGGETGFLSSLDVEDLKKKFKNDLKDLDRWKANPVKVGHTIMDSIEFLNRAIEDSNRFAVYMTSIQYGRSIDEAVNDAKDVTLNFNRKGTGEYGWQMIRNLYLFINPAVQSLQTLGALVKHHPFKFTSVTASWLASGVLVPIVNAALMSLLGGDDDKDKYWQFTKWDRRNNLIMWVPFTHEYVKIPLAQEFRAFYGVGDMIASKMMGGELAEESWSQYAEDLLGQVVDMLPLDPTGYDGNIAVSLMPNAIRPVFELAFNVDFTGKPLFKETEYNKYDPNFTKAYVGTPDWLVRASKMVNSIGNDYPDVQQNSIDAFGDPRYNLNNPAVVDHVLSSYLGGAYTMGSQVLGVLTKSLNDPKEIKVADIPLFSKFVSNPDDRPVTKKQGDEFWNMKENHDRAANTLSKLKKQAKVDGDYSMLERFYGSEEYKQYKQDDVKVKKYEEDKKKERAEESGEEYRPHKLNAEDIYKAHATPKDDFEDLKLKQLYTKLNGFKSAYDLLVDTAPNQSEDYYNTNKAAIDAIDEISLDKQEISELKKGFLDDGKDAYNAEDMKQIRELRKKILAVLEEANKVVVANQKAKAKKK